MHWNFLLYPFRSIGVRLSELVANAPRCEQLAQSLVDTHCPLTGKLRLVRAILGTEYDRARARIRWRAFRLTWGIHLLRLLRLNSDLIRASQQLRQMRQACRNCPEVNGARVRNGQGFACLLSGKVCADSLRYRLNEKGQVVARV